MEQLLQAHSAAAKDEAVGDDLAACVRLAAVFEAFCADVVAKVTPKVAALVSRTAELEGENHPDAESLRARVEVRGALASP